MTPSKIPVGSFRVEEEKAINRALNGHHDSNRQSNDKDRGHSPPPPPSKIPKFFKSSNYMRVKVTSHSIWNLNKARMFNSCKRLGFCGFNAYPWRTLRCI